MIAFNLCFDLPLIQTNLFAINAPVHFGIAAAAQGNAVVNLAVFHGDHPGAQIRRYFLVGLQDGFKQTLA